MKKYFYSFLMFFYDLLKKILSHMLALPNLDEEFSKILAAELKL